MLPTPDFELVQSAPARPHSRRCACRDMTRDVNRRQPGMVRWFLRLVTRAEVPAAGEVDRIPVPFNP